MRPMLRIATLVTLSACPGPAVLVPDAGSDVDAGVDSGTPVVDAGLDCRARVSPDSGCGTLSWTESPTMGRLRNHHSSAIAEVDAGVFLYVVAGVNGSTVLPMVDRAPLASDGGIGAFEQLMAPARLPQGVGGGTMQKLEGTLVFAGGTMGGSVTDQSWFAQLRGDGSLSEFFTNGSTGHPRMHPGSVVHGGHVYVMGGFRDPEVWDDVVKARWYPNDTLAPWNPGGSLPGKRTHMALTVVGDFVYLTGGLDQSPYGGPPMLKTTFRGRFDANGDLGGWVPQTELPVALATHASAYWGGYLYVMGGITDTPSPVQERRVWRAPIGADDNLGAWEEASPLPVGRGHVHDLPIYKNHLYSIGGAIDFSLNSTAATQVGSFQ